MFQNYILTAWRHIAKNKLFSAINIFGLAVGLMCGILILLYVKDEVSYDRWMPEGERIVRIHSGFFPAGRPPFQTVRSAGRMMEALEAYAPDQIEVGVRLFRNQTTIIKDDNAFYESITFADPTFFNVFDLPFAHGDAKSAFEKPLSLVVTEETAFRYFGRTDVIGETLVSCCLQQDQLELAITGVIKDIPENSHMDMSMLVHVVPSMFDFAPNLYNTWTSVNMFTYFKLKEGANAESLLARYNRWLDTESIFVKQSNDGSKPTDVIKPNVMPLLDLHLHARKDAGNIPDLTPMGDIKMVYTFSGVAILILVIASINFMNLSTARAAKRAREVALRKVLGASRSQVAGQFLGEAISVTLIALVFALVGVELMLPFYSEILGRDLSFSIFEDFSMVLMLSGITVLIGLISGTYPATYLSRFLPARILKANKSADVEGAGSFRSMLVVFQFAISIGLAVCTAVVYGQTMYAKNMDVGYQFEGKLALTSVDNLGQDSNYDALRQELEKLPSVTGVSYSSEVPSQDNNNNTYFTVQGAVAGDGEAPSAVLNYHSMGYGFFEDYDVSPVAGRTFNREFGSDMIVPIEQGEDRIGAASVVLNESAVRALGIATPEAAIGTVLRANVFRSGTHDLTIIGVVPDIYFRSLKFGVRPSVYWVLPRSYGAATISFKSSDVQSLVADVERVWRDHFPMTPISYEFVSDMLAAQYASEDTQAQLFAAFSILALLIACLGLFGLAAFSAEQRTREIGIRKVLGATVVDIVRLLVWQFSRPVLVANIIAWPIAWYYMSGWLEGFQYRLDSSFILVTALVAGGVALLVAWVTVASRAVSVAQTNPIHALRYE